ncbi:MAG: hypothetical protein ACYTG1_10200 [Planctomycetota bacterium]|jgi:hypothetical protein
MGFRSGSVSYARFEVVGDAPASVGSDLIDALAGHVLVPPSVGAPPEVQAGWCAGQHVFDSTFDAHTVAFGERLLFGMRIDTNRVPAEIRRAHRAVAEAAQREATGQALLSRVERQSAREEADDRGRRELAEGRHRQSAMVPVLWDLRRRRLLAPAFSDVKVAALADLMRSSFDVGLQPLSSGALAGQLVGQRGLTRELEDARPSPFTPPPPAAGADDAAGTPVTVPAVPWTRGGPQPRDFLGNEMLWWLWWRIEHDGGVLDTPAGPVAVALERALDMDCAWDVTGRQTLRADAPARLPEAAAARRTGKWPRKAGLLVARPGDEDAQWSLTFQADRFLVSGAKLPRSEDAATPRDIVEHRLDSITALDETVEALFTTFLGARFGNGWAGERDAIRAWAAGRGAGAGATTAKVEV